MEVNEERERYFKCTTPALEEGKEETKAKGL